MMMSLVPQPPSHIRGHGEGRRSVCYMSCQTSSFQEFRHNAVPVPCPVCSPMPAKEPPHEEGREAAFLLFLFQPRRRLTTVVTVAARPHSHARLAAGSTEASQRHTGHAATITSPSRPVTPSLSRPNSLLPLLPFLVTTRKQGGGGGCSGGRGWGKGGKMKACPAQFLHPTKSPW